MKPGPIVHKRMGSRIACKRKVAKFESSRWVDVSCSICMRCEWESFKKSVARQVEQAQETGQVPCKVCGVLTEDHGALIQWCSPECASKRED